MIERPRNPWRAWLHRVIFEADTPIVTLTTVGYGDIAPRTVLGQMLASLLMITGYAIIASLPASFPSSWPVPSTMW